MANSLGINTAEWVPMPIQYGPPLPKTWNILWPWVKTGETGETGATIPEISTIPSFTIPGTDITINVPTIPGVPTTPTIPSIPTGATYNLTATVSPSGVGVITPSSGSYAAGTTVPLLATPANGYAFSGWSGNAQGVNPSTTIVMDGDKSVTANFAATSATGGVTAPAATSDAWKANYNYSPINMSNETGAELLGIYLPKNIRTGQAFTYKLHVKLPKTSIYNRAPYMSGNTPGIAPSVWFADVGIWRLSTFSPTTPEEAYTYGAGGGFQGSAPPNPIPWNKFDFYPVGGEPTSYSKYHAIKVPLSSPDDIYLVDATVTPMYTANEIVSGETIGGGSMAGKEPIGAFPVPPGIYDLLISVYPNAQWGGNVAIQSTGCKVSILK